MPRYNGNKQEPRSRARKFVQRKRHETDRSQKDDPRHPWHYNGYAHGKNGASGND